MKLEKDGKTAKVDLDLIWKVRLELTKLLEKQNDINEIYQITKEYLDEIWAGRELENELFTEEVTLTDERMINNLNFLLNELSLTDYLNQNLIFGYFREFN